MHYRVAVDVGGTFTDVVLADETGALHLGKGLTTQERLFLGVQEGLHAIAEERGEDARSLLGTATLFLYGTTEATNAILEGKTARTAFFVTAGFPDILVLREGGKANAYDFTVAYPEPYVPRRLTFEIDERIDSEGEIVTPLDKEKTRQLIRSLRKRRIEAVAVCFLWSLVNPCHESAVGRLIEEELPGVPYTLSHDLNPVIREYRRASSTVIDASLKPVMERHLRDLEEDLREAGFRGDILAATSAGGVVPLEALAQRPIHSVRSGPALAPIAAREYGKAEGRIASLIVCDAGGTSFDVSLVQGGVVKFSRETWLGARFTGHITGLSSVDVRSIGAGGGSIAWIDSGGLLRVGPESAGADPGPACYGRGGTSPTVTDAALVLGYIDPAYFLGGRIELDAEAAWKCLGAVAGELAESTERTAHFILTLASEAMIQAIHAITINEGVDPRDSLLVAGGGAAGLNIVPIARELECREVLIPRTAGGLSACGAHFADIVAEFSLSKLAHTGVFPYRDVNEALRLVGKSMGTFASSLQQWGVTDFHEEYFVEARYPRQVWELEVPLMKGRFDLAEDVRELVESFHEHHERVFAVKEPGAELECLYWKGRLTGLLDRPSLLPIRGSGKGRDAAPVSHRKAYFVEAGSIDVPIYLGTSLSPGAVIDGPAVIEEATTTIVLYRNSSATVTRFGNYLLRVQ